MKTTALDVNEICVYVNNNTCAASNNPAVQESNGKFKVSIIYFDAFMLFKVLLLYIISM